MANTAAPFGFSQWTGLGVTPSYEMVTKTIDKDNTVAIFTGDAVIELTTGYIDVKVAADAVRLAGIFMGCTYLNTSLSRVVWSPYYPGANVATNDVTAYVVNDPNARFLVQSSGASPIAFANIGENIDVAATPVGNTITGRSAMAVAYGSLNTTNTLPFRIVDLYSTYAPPGVNGTDDASANNMIIVGFNNIDAKQLTGLA